MNGTIAYAYVASFEKLKKRDTNFTFVLASVQSCTWRHGVVFFFFYVPHHVCECTNDVVPGCARTNLDELIEGNGIVPVCVCFLYGPVGNAAQLLVRDVYANHHPQDL